MNINITELFEDIADVIRSKLDTTQLIIDEKEIINETWFAGTNNIYRDCTLDWSDTFLVTFDNQKYLCTPYNSAIPTSTCLGDERLRFTSPEDYETWGEPTSMDVPFHIGCELYVDGDGSSWDEDMWSEWFFYFSDNNTHSITIEKVISDLQFKTADNFPNEILNLPPATKPAWGADCMNVTINYTIPSTLDDNIHNKDRYHSINFSGYTVDEKANIQSFSDTIQVPAIGGISGTISYKLVRGTTLRMECYKRNKNLMGSISISSTDSQGFIHTNNDTAYVRTQTVTAFIAYPYLNAGGMPLEDETIAVQFYIGGTY